MSDDAMTLPEPWRHPVFHEQQLENARLRRENERLVALLAPSHRFPARWDLTRQEAGVLSVLYVQGGCLSYARIGAAMQKGAEGSSPRHISVVITRIRAKTGPFGVEIESYYGTGYGLSVEGRAAVNAALVKRGA